MTSQTCQDKVKRWVTADFVKVSRRVSINSTFCFDANLDHSIDSASLNNSKELHIRNFQLQTCVRQRQSLKCFYLICRFQNGGYQNLAYFRNVLLCKYKRSQKNWIVESRSNPWIWLERFPGRLYRLPRGKQPLLWPFLWPLPRKNFIPLCTFLKFHTHLEKNLARSFQNVFDKSSRVLNLVFSRN